MTPLSVTPGASANLALEAGGNLSNIFSIVDSIDSKTPPIGLADDQTSVPVTISSNQFGQPGLESRAVFTVQGINGGNAVPVSPSGNFATETGGNLDSINNKLTGVATINSSILAGPNNVATALRDSFQTFTSGVNWTLSSGSGDIVRVDGNSGGASYLVISKDPLTANTETSITSTALFTIPTELTTGISMSQRTLGQELAVEIVSSDSPNTSPGNLTISSIAQSGGTLTVITSTQHGLVPGARIGILGVSSDSRLNYPTIVVGNISNAYAFTVTQGPMGAITSIASATATTGTVYYRPPLGYAQDGVSLIFESNVLTNASMYVRQDNGATWSSGTVNQNQSITVGTTASAKYDNNTLYTYSFTPTNEYRIMLQSDKVTLSDANVDSASFAGTNTRISRTQQVPNNSKTYRLRYRFTNDAGLTVPTAKIVSAQKSGSTTATINTVSAHGLGTGDWVVIYGLFDQTNFTNQITQVQVASISTTTSFTVAFGISATATSYGGMVARVQGQNVPSGFLNLSVQQAVVATNAAGSNELTLTGPTTSSTNFTSYLIGDYVNVYGVRNNANGGDVGVDGTYRVVTNATASVTLSPIGTTTLSTTFTSTNCGGFIIKRTDARIHFSRMLNFQRERVELNSRADPSNGYPVLVNNTLTIGAGFLAVNTATTDGPTLNVTSTATITPTSINNPTLTYQVLCNVLTAGGTGQTMDIVIQESEDTGTNFYDVYHFPRITAAGQFRTPLITFSGNRLRYIQTLGGTSSFFNRTITRISSHSVVPCFRQFYDRNINPNASSSVTTAYNVQGTKDLTVIVSMGAATSAPTMQVQISPDNSSSWVQVGSNIVTAASSSTFFQVAGVQANFVRLIVSLAGSGATLNFVFIKAMG
jgi:hypothetical protein